MTVDIFDQHVYTHQLQATVVDVEKQTSQLSKTTRIGCLLVVRGEIKNDKLLCKATIYRNVKIFQAYITKLLQDQTPNIISIHCFNWSDIKDNLLTLNHHPNNVYSDWYKKKAPFLKIEKAEPDGFVNVKKLNETNLKAKQTIEQYVIKPQFPQEVLHHRLTPEEAKNYAAIDVYSNSDAASEGITIARRSMIKSFGIPQEKLKPGTIVKILLYNGGDDLIPVWKGKMNKRGFYSGKKACEPFQNNMFKKPKMGTGVQKALACKLIVDGIEYRPISTEMV